MGTKLIIPIAPGRSNSETVAYSHHPTHYKVRKGDTVDSVADDFEVPADKMRKWNHLRGNALAAGRSLVIYKPLGEASLERTASAAPSKVQRPQSGKRVFHASPMTPSTIK